MKWLIFFTFSVLVSCGKNGKDGTNGIDGATLAPLNPVVSSIDLQDVLPGLVCSEGGVSLVIFTDENNDGVFQDTELITKRKTICNGRSETLTYEPVSSSSQCPGGGIKISSSSNPTVVEVCNGINGVDGSFGKDSSYDINGIVGSQLMPIKFCNDQGHQFSEYGLLINGELFAVYWETSTGSAKKSDAYLTKLDITNFENDREENCLFEVK